MKVLFQQRFSPLSEVNDNKLYNKVCGYIHRDVIDSYKVDGRSFYDDRQIEYFQQDNNYKTLKSTLELIKDKNQDLLIVYDEPCDYGEDSQVLTCREELEYNYVAYENMKVKYMTFGTFEHSGKVYITIYVM